MRFKGKPSKWRMRNAECTSILWDVVDYSRARIALLRIVAPPLTIRLDVRPRDVFRAAADERS